MTHTQFYIANMTFSGKLKRPVNRNLLSRNSFRRLTINGKSSKFYVYENGTFVCVGLKNIEKLPGEMHWFLQGLGRSRKGELENIKLNNIVASGSYGKTNLHTVFYKLRKYYLVDYSPELFPSLMIYGKNFFMSLFSSGKFILTGMRYVDDIAQVVITIQHILE